VLVVDRRRTLRKTSRVLTYVPEISDRKFRYQTFLQNSLSSPPHLRRRTREQQASTPPAPRHATPDRMETRNKTAKLDKTQLDGAIELSEEEPSDSAMESSCKASNGSPEYNVSERIALRNSLLKRKREMERELESFNTRKQFLLERKEVSP